MSAPRLSIPGVEYGAPAKVMVSAKRSTVVDGHWVCFNKPKSAFFLVTGAVTTGIHQRLSGGVDAITLRLDDYARELILATWREGKKAWMDENMGGQK